MRKIYLLSAILIAVFGVVYLNSPSGSTRIRVKYHFAYNDCVCFVRLDECMISLDAKSVVLKKNSPDGQTLNGFSGDVFKEDIEIVKKYLKKHFDVE